MNNAWSNIQSVCKRELTGYFASPVAYVFIVIFLTLIGFFYIQRPIGTVL